jgi:hypothetical protein
MNTANRKLELTNEYCVSTMKHQEWPDNAVSKKRVKKVWLNLRKRRQDAYIELSLYDGRSLPQQQWNVSIYKKRKL